MPAVTISGSKRKLYVQFVIFVIKKTNVKFDCFPDQNFAAFGAALC